MKRFVLLAVIAIRVILSSSTTPTNNELIISNGKIPLMKRKDEDSIQTTGSQDYCPLLPFEVWFLIMNFVDDRTGKNMESVCKAFYHISQKLNLPLKRLQKWANQCSDDMKEKFKFDMETACFKIRSSWEKERYSLDSFIKIRQGIKKTDVLKELLVQTTQGVKKLKLPNFSLLLKYDYNGLVIQLLHIKELTLAMDGVDVLLYSAYQDLILNNDGTIANPVSNQEEHKEELSIYSKNKGARYFKWFQSVYPSFNPKHKNHFNFNWVQSIFPNIDTLQLDLQYSDIPFTAEDILSALPRLKKLVIRITGGSLELRCRTDLMSFLAMLQDERLVLKFDVDLMESNYETAEMAFEIFDEELNDLDEIYKMKERVYFYIKYRSDLPEIIYKNAKQIHSIDFDIK